MKSGRITPKVNIDWWRRILHMRSHFQDGGHDVISRVYKMANEHSVLYYADNCSASRRSRTRLLARRVWRH